MSTLLSARTALLAGLIGLAGAHAPAFALPDHVSVVASCPSKGRDPSAAMLQFVCGVGNPSDFTTLPDWDTLELMATDGNPRGGSVVAKLECMSRASGAVSTVALVKSVPSASPKKVAVRLTAPLNFKGCGYSLHLDVKTTNAGATAQMVVLRK